MAEQSRLEQENMMLKAGIRTALKHMENIDRRETRAIEIKVLATLAKHKLIETLEQTDEYVGMLERNTTYDTRNQEYEG